jgi:4-hydroxybenzoate polyprenyltransferase
MNAYLRLARVSNLPTVWTNVLAGVVVAGGAIAGQDAGVLIDWRLVAGIAIAMSLLYCGGMWMNDACDAESDARARADRPIPRGDVTLGEVWLGTVLLMAAGISVLFLTGAHVAAWPWTIALILAIAYYDIRHKRDPLGPLAMGICRGLLYVIAASAFSGVVGTPVWIAAAVLTGYVLLLTFVGKSIGPRAGVVMPLLIAGISFVDAAVILVAGGGAVLATIAAAGFVLTLVGQKVVSGT